MSRRMVPWLIGIGSVALVTLAAGLVFAWIAAALQVETNDFYTSYTGESLEEEVYRYYDQLSMRSYLLAELARPMLFGAVAAALALLAVLARAWDVRHEVR